MVQVRSNRVLALVAGMAVATVIVFWPIIPELWTTWLEDSNNSHGLLVPIISLYLIWGKREQLSMLPVRPSRKGLLLLGIGLAIFLVALRVELALPGRLALIVSLAGLVWGNLGPAALRCLAFPLAFLCFMVPVPDSITGVITFPLQLLASALSAPLLVALGIPVLREGNMLYFANASLEVADACSGIRSAVSFLTLGILMTYLSGSSLRVSGKLILVASTIPLALLVNVARVVGTGVLAAHIGTRAARGFLHEFSGFLVFALGFVMLWVLTDILRSLEGKRLKHLSRTSVLVEAG